MGMIPAVKYHRFNFMFQFKCCYARFFSPLITAQLMGAAPRTAAIMNHED
jgi:hypothetical protein